MTPRRGGATAGGMALGLVSGQLSRNMWRLIREGDPAALRYATRSDAAMAVIVACANAGWTFERTLQLFLSPQNAIGDWLRTDYRGNQRTDRAARRLFARSWDAAVKFVAANPAIRDRATACELIAKILDAAQNSRWSGVGGATDLAVLSVHIGIAAGLASLTYGASVRQVGEMAGVSIAAVSRSHRRLRRKGWVRRRARGRDGTASTWKLHLPESATQMEQSAHTVVQGKECSTFVALDHDVWRWGGLGKTKMFVYAELSTEPIPAKEIAARLQNSVRTVQRHLRTLKEFGLAERVMDGWVRGKGTLEEVAVELGTAETGARQRKKHRADRAAYRRRPVPRRAGLIGAASQGAIKVLMVG